MLKVRTAALVSVFALLAIEVPAQDWPVANWAAPLYWSPGEAARAPAGRPREEEGWLIGKAAAATVPTSPVPLIGVTPCRIADTRDGTRPPGYGPPPMAPGAPRDFTLTGVCGIAATAQAVSLNITVVNPQGLGYILLYPQGGGQPVVSTLNYTAGVTVANAAIVPLGAGGAITVAVAVSGTDVLIDTNGYYAAAGVGASNTFLGVSAGNFTMSGDGNTAVGTNALASNTTGSGNVATGTGALYANTDGYYNSAHGSAALGANTSGTGNTANGAFALSGNTTGNNNTATGYGALLFNTAGFNNTATGANALPNNSDGYRNTATGTDALGSNTTGVSNTAVGDNAMYSNDIGIKNVAIGSFALASKTGGGYNTAVGESALINLTGGVFNTAIGVSAGSNLITGDDNVYFYNHGVASESYTIRIGNPALQSRAFLAGVRGVTTGVPDAIPVMIDSAGQFGTISSSARFKEDIADMAEASSGLLKLRPVTFRYRGQHEGARQYGLVAEEVEEVLPELVVHGSSGEAETVLYHEMPAMLVNELQKQQRLNQAQDEEICALRARLAELDAMVRSSVK